MVLMVFIIMWCLTMIIFTSSLFKKEKPDPLLKCKNSLIMPNSGNLIWWKRKWWSKKRSTKLWKTKLIRICKIKMKLSTKQKTKTIEPNMILKLWIRMSPTFRRRRHSLKSLKKKKMSLHLLPRLMIKDMRMELRQERKPWETTFLERLENLMFLKFLLQQLNISHLHHLFCLFEMYLEKISI